MTMKLGGLRELFGGPPDLKTFDHRTISGEMRLDWKVRSCKTQVSQKWPFFGFALVPQKNVQCSFFESANFFYASYGFDSFFYVFFYTCLTCYELVWVQKIIFKTFWRPFKAEIAKFQSEYSTGGFCFENQNIALCSVFGGANFFYASYGSDSFFCVFPDIS